MTLTLYTYMYTIPYGIDVPKEQKSGVTLLKKCNITIQVHSIITLQPLSFFFPVDISTSSVNYISLILLDISKSVSGGNVLPRWVDLDAAHTPSSVSNGRGISRIAASILKTRGVNRIRVQHTDKLL